MNQGGNAFVGDFRSTKVEFFEGGVFSKMFDSGISDCKVAQAEVGVVIVQSLFLLFLSATRLPVEESAFRRGFIGEIVEDGLELRTF